MATLGERLRDLIYERGLDQKKIAELFNIPVSTLNGYVTDYRTPDIKLQKKFADFFGVTVDYLIGHTDERYAEGKKFVKENMDLIRGRMSYEEMSRDIGRQLDNLLHSKVFTPGYLENLSNGKVTPTPQRIATLARYARVEEKFFYRLNDEKDLRQARESKKTGYLNDSLNAFTKDPGNKALIEFAKAVKEKGIDISELQELLLCTKDINRYLGFLQRLINKGIDPDDIESFNLKVKL